MKNTDQSSRDNLAPEQPNRKVVLVGHCGFDESLISRAVATALPGITVESAYDTNGLVRHTGPGSLLLVNRVLDGRFGTRSGIDLIAELIGGDRHALMMLISDYADAQAQAVQAGALPGFGKSELGTPETTGKLRAAIGIDASAG
jgi:two-component system, chemotaxis family, chemotaxis protein CheY